MKSIAATPCRSARRASPPPGRWRAARSPPRRGATAAAAGSAGPAPRPGARTLPAGRAVSSPSPPSSDLLPQLLAAFSHEVQELADLDVHEVDVGRKESARG